MPILKPNKSIIPWFLLKRTTIKKGLKYKGLSLFTACLIWLETGSGTVVGCLLISSPMIEHKNQFKKKYWGNTKKKQLSTKSYFILDQIQTVNHKTPSDSFIILYQNVYVYGKYIK